MGNVRLASPTRTPVNIAARKSLRIAPGDTVRVWQRIEERGKSRLQAFEGIVIAVKHGKEMGATFTVRRAAGGYGVERIFPLYSPRIEDIEVLRRAKVRRAKLYMVREKTAKEIKRILRRAQVVRERLSDLQSGGGAGAPVDGGDSPEAAQ